jgi:hypothetical protein
VYALVKYFVALARSFFHEAATLLDRRHALRFGRLYVYLEPGDLTLSALAEAFDWNRQATSAFLDIRPEVVTETLLHRALDLAAAAPEAAFKALSELMKNSISAKTKN